MMDRKEIVTIKIDLRDSWTIPVPGGGPDLTMTFKAEMYKKQYE